MKYLEDRFYRNDLLKIADKHNLLPGENTLSRELAAISHIQKFQGLSPSNRMELTFLRDEINREWVDAYLKEVRAQ